MKIAQWGVYLNNSNFVQTYISKSFAEAAIRHGGGTLILLTGELPEPKKKVKLAPALCRGEAGWFMLSASLFASEEDAKGCLDFLCWPAPQADEDGFIEVEVEG